MAINVKLFLPLLVSCSDLFLVSQSDGTNQLVYNYYKENDGKQLFVNIGDRKPIAIFTGYVNSAAIDSEGAVIPITKYIFRSNKSGIESFFLPGHEKAVSIACCNDSLIVLSESGRVFISSDYKKPSFKEVKELNGIEIVYISGVHHHCLAVSKEGKIFVYGENSYGQLGLGDKIKKKF